MTIKSTAAVFVLGGLTYVLAGCTGEKQMVDVDTVLSEPKAYVGSDVCKTCHLEHYDAWQKTVHSRMTQDAKANPDALVVNFDEQRIREDLKKKEGLKVPAEEIFIPKVDDILYTIGSQWKQRFIIKQDDDLYISPVQYNVDTDRFVNYHEHDWKERPWLKKCGGCHATGVNLENKTFVEPGVGCETCHGPGSWHAALPKTAVFQKRQTIVNPEKLTMGVAVQICGSCHNRGKSKLVKGSSWPVGYKPGKALTSYYESTSFEAGDVKHVYANEFAKGHHQQYIDWQQSKHYKEGVTCMSCHFSHQLGSAPIRSQTYAKGSKVCLECHEQMNKEGPHAIHSFANCVGCHMPRIAKSAESGDIHSHVFVTLLPEDTLRNPDIPNSCQTCHKHKDEDLEQLQKRYDELIQRTPKVATGPSEQAASGG
ncbi:MAG: multiheme c-type cytochrome [Gammaproteobacteria bacterium]|nr:multiheme c-type cytochrome [Gammaproteobacteria bacterium]